MPQAMCCIVAQIRAQGLQPTRYGQLEKKTLVETTIPYLVLVPQFVNFETWKENDS